MGLYFFLYIPVSLVSILIGRFFLQRYKNIAGYLFFLFVIFSGAWFILYFLFISGLYNNPEFLLYISRATFTMGILSVYSLTFFFKYFEPIQKSVPVKKLATILVVYAVFSLFAICTDNIIAGLVFSQTDGVYREVYGKFFFLLPILYIIFFFFFIYYGFRNSKKFSLLSRLRVRNIAHATFLSILVLIFLQLVLPLFGIWILEKEVILIYLFFVVYSTYTIRRYYFSPLLQEYGLAKIGIVFLSGIISIFGLNFLKYFYLKVPFYIESFWLSRDYYSAIDSIIVIALFFIAYTNLKNIFLTDTSEQKLKYDIDLLKQAISDTTTIEYLNKILQGGIRNIFKANFSKITVLEENDTRSELKKYFSFKGGDTIFLNDVVFIEENKTKFQKEVIMREIDKEAMLVFPIVNTEGKTFGFYSIGKKPFGDFYTMNETRILRGLVKFLGLHIKYLSTYKKIQDYSLHLDERIDEKTIEYNDLINKQKEFISMISHEIRSPIGSTIFQVDSLVNDIENKKLDTLQIKNTVKNIGDQLVNVGELLKKLFSIQYFDTRKVVLLKEKIQIGSLLEKEFDIQSRMHEDISFMKNISPQIGFVSLDKIHFQQVITNLLENAIKFADPIDPVVLIECGMMGKDHFYINIEDNGNGYGDTDLSTLFEKYSKGNHAQLGLGMGLYLCKRIITMHGGTITANHGKVLKGASFVIELPR